MGAVSHTCHTLDFIWLVSIISPSQVVVICIAVQRTSCLCVCVKYLASKREECKLAQTKINVRAHFLLCHVESMWMTLEDVVERLGEQLPALKQYLLKDMKKR